MSARRPQTRRRALGIRLRWLRGQTGGQSAIEYLLLILIVVIPLGIFLPTALRMVQLYFSRGAATIASPLL
jgi:hypothetical protein